MKRYLQGNETLSFDQQELIHLLPQFYGFNQLRPDWFILTDKRTNSIIEVKLYSDHAKLCMRNVCRTFYSNEQLLAYLEQASDRHEIDILSTIVITLPQHTKQVVNAAIRTRELTKNLVRVKSSNLWSYGINLRDRKDKTGDVLVQFKGRDGGPTGGLYIYYDFPVTLWRKWITAPSKGHFFWQYVRNQFQYSKLDGNKKGKLPNAINN